MGEDEKPDLETRAVLNDQVLYVYEMSNGITYIGQLEKDIHDGKTITLKKVVVTDTRSLVYKFQNQKEISQLQNSLDHYLRLEYFSVKDSLKLDYYQLDLSQRVGSRKISVTDTVQFTPLKH
jgi:hypothetical protein